jgi:hypothetical protein
MAITPREKVLVSMRKSVKDKLQAMAFGEDRTVSAFVRNLIEAEWERRNPLYCANLDMTDIYDLNDALAQELKSAAPRPVGKSLALGMGYQGPPTRDPNVEWYADMHPKAKNPGFTGLQVFTQE